MIKVENLIFIEEAMNYPEVIKMVSEASDRIWYKISNAASFEHDCYRDIGKEILRKKVKNLGGLATHIIRRKEAYHVKNEPAKQALSVESLAGLNDEGGEDRPFEIQDVLADVERGVIGDLRHKEIVTNLAEGDDLNREILNAWTEGYNDSEISRVLANSFGGKSSVHRIAIQRFKKACKKRMGGSLEIALAY